MHNTPGIKKILAVWFSIEFYQRTIVCGRELCHFFCSRRHCAHCSRVTQSCKHCLLKPLISIKATDRTLLLATSGSTILKVTPDLARTDEEVPTRRAKTERGVTSTRRDTTRRDVFLSRRGVSRREDVTTRRFLTRQGGNRREGLLQGGSYIG
jgi:hypothetical protein